MNDLIARFWGFDKLIGSALVKFVYYLGLAGIALALVVGVVASLAMLTSNFAMGLGLLIAYVLGCAVGVVFWRFTCEMAILAFQTYNRLGEIRDRLPPAA